MKNIIITGASGGIGRAVVDLLVDIPCHLILIDVNEESLEQLPKNKCEGKIIKIASDISTIEKCLDIVAKCEGGVGAFIHMAGILDSDLEMSKDTSKWDRVIDANLKNAYLMSAAVMDNLDQRRHINFVFATSVAFRRGAYENICYSIAKSGIVGLTRSLAKRLGPKGVVNAISPGVITTKMPGEYITRHRDRLMQNIPMKRFGAPEEVAKLIRFLASDDCTYITGQVINIDGGSVNS